MSQEFQESDIIFSDNNKNYFNYKQIIQQELHRTNNSMSTMSYSLPVNIPGHNFQNLTDSDDDFEDDGEIVPPHVIVARRVAGKMPFSVCTGNGRTLKGRDLSRVRNSVLRMTGFLET